jgi:membrane protein required for colicin V production
MIFDVVIYALAALAAVMGFRSGFLRSLATILGYVIAAPFALGVAPALSVILAQRVNLAPAFSGLVLAVVLLLAGIIMGALLRRAVNELVGPQVGVLDRLLGALLGAARIALVAVLIVVIFDRVIPVNREPLFLKGSQLRPWLSAAGQAGVKKLPADVVDYIDRLKRTRGIL